MNLFKYLSYIEKVKKIYDVIEDNKEEIERALKTVKKVSEEVSEDLKEIVIDIKDTLFGSKENDKK